MRILIYGSTYLTELVVRELVKHHYVVGHVPSTSPVFAGDIGLPIVSEDTPCDIRLSIQYDKKIQNTENAYNLHTGLLPLYGGCDILYHTLENKESEQGLTFHTITDKFDEGAVLLKMSYPVLPDDSVVDLYHRIASIIPHFAVAGVAMIDAINISELPVRKPALYKRGDVQNAEQYKTDAEELKEYISESHRV